jgi:MHS family citrate/tricarballylate:H+ symporter-like MFS transporter
MNEFSERVNNSEVSRHALDPQDSKLGFRSVLAATIGNMLEFYDFVTFSFFAIEIGHAFFPFKNQYASLMFSLATFGIGFVTRPIGALIIGTYSDRVGRRPAMLLSFTMMGFAIAVLALTPSYASIGIAAPVIIILARLVQGLSLGGEVGPTTAYLLEAAPAAKRGTAVAWQPASQQIAATTGALIGWALTQLMSPEAIQSYGWRIAFLLGALTLPFGLWLRSNLPETIHLAEGNESARQGDERAGAVSSNIRLLVLGLIIVASGTIITYVTQYMTTYAESTLRVAPSLAFATTLVANAAGIAAAMWGGRVVDRIGRWPLMIWPQLAVLFATLPVFLWIVQTRSAWALLSGLGLLSFVNSLPYVAFYVAFAESLPKSIRGRSFATVYAVAVASFGGTAQLVVAWLIHVTGSALAPAWYMVVATAVGLFAMLKLGETSPANAGRSGLSREPS